jgi:glycosyltransferase involved in cell wall biosynthesis
MSGTERPHGGPERGRLPRLLLAVTLAEAGGAQSYVCKLLPSLVERFDVTVAAHGPGPVRHAAEAAGVPFVPLRYVRRPLHPLRDALGLIELVWLFRRVRPDIVHLNSSKMGFLGRLAASLTGVPVRVVTAHGWAFGWYSGIASRMFRLADRLMEPLTTCVITVSHQQAAAGLRAGTCRVGRTVVIPNAVEIGPASRRSTSGGPVRLVSVGRLSPPKDFVTLERALALVPSGSVRARLVGDGRERPALEAEAARLGLDGEVEFLGERRDVTALLADADLFVLSSHSEGMPMSVLEAMAAGLPVVASAVGGVPEVVVSGDTGLLVPPGDPATLAAALERLADDPVLRLRLGNAGRHRAEQHFGLARFERAHLELFERELRARGLPEPAPSAADRRRGARRGEAGSKHEPRDRTESPLGREPHEQQAGVRAAEVSV